jgi:hypothetical protein
MVLAWDLASWTRQTLVPVTLKDGNDISKDTYLAVSLNDLAAVP